MKFYLYPDERYPDYGLDGGVKEEPQFNEPWTIKAKGEIELTEDEYFEWLAVRDQYDKWMRRFDGGNNERSSRATQEDNDVNDPGGAR